MSDSPPFISGKSMHELGEIWEAWGQAARAKRVGMRAERAARKTEMERGKTELMDGRYHVGQHLTGNLVKNVLLCHDHQRHCDVVMIVLKRTAQLTGYWSKNLWVGGQIATQMNHPGVVRYLDYGTLVGIPQVNGLPFLTMDYIPGASIHQLCAGSPLPWQRACAITLSLLTALEAVHGAGIVHRDIKPQNVMVRADDTVTIIDFETAWQRTSPTGLQSVGDPPGFRCPEYLMRETPHPSWDVYAAGLTLGAMLTGAEPHYIAGGPDPTDVMLDRWLDLIAMVTGLGDASAVVPRAIIDIVTRAVISESDDALRSAGDLRRALVHAVTQAGNARLLEPGLDQPPEARASAHEANHVTESLGLTGAAHITALREAVRETRRPRLSGVYLVDRVAHPVFVTPPAGSSAHWYLANLPARMIGGEATDRLEARLDGQVRHLDLRDRDHQAWLNDAFATGRLEIARLGPVTVLDETIACTTAGAALVRRLRDSGVAIWLTSWDDLERWDAWEAAQGKRTPSQQRGLRALLPLREWATRSNVRQAHSAADGVIVASRHLAGVLRERGECRDVRYLPLAVDPSMVEPGPREPCDPVRVGFAGHASKYRTGDLNAVMPVFRELWTDRRCEVHLWGVSSGPGAPPSNRQQLGSERELIAHAAIDDYGAYCRSLAVLDIALAPLRADGAIGAFNRCKARSKVLEHGSHGSALVLADLEPYADLEHGIHCLKANTPDEWRTAILALVEDAELRQRLGEGARHYVLENHSTTAVAPLWQAWYDDITGRNGT